VQKVKSIFISAVLAVSVFAGQDTICEMMSKKVEGTNIQVVFSKCVENNSGKSKEVSCETMIENHENGSVVTRSRCNEKKLSDNEFQIKSRSIGKDTTAKQKLGENQ
jgi:hypothetical protein